MVGDGVARRVGAVRCGPREEHAGGWRVHPVAQRDVMLLFGAQRGEAQVDLLSVILMLGALDNEIEEPNAVQRERGAALRVRLDCHPKAHVEAARGHVDRHRDVEVSRRDAQVGGVVREGTRRSELRSAVGGPLMVPVCEAGVVFAHGAAVWHGETSKFTTV